MIVALGAGPWDALFGGGNVPAFLLASVSALVAGVVASRKLPRLSNNVPAAFHGFGWWIELLIMVTGIQIQLMGQSSVSPFDDAICVCIHLFCYVYVYIHYILLNTVSISLHKYLRTRNFCDISFLLKTMHKIFCLSIFLEKKNRGQCHKELYNG